MGAGRAARCAARRRARSAITAAHHRLSSQRSRRVAVALQTRRSRPRARLTARPRAEQPPARGPAASRSRRSRRARRPAAAGRRRGCRATTRRCGRPWVASRTGSKAVDASAVSASPASRPSIVSHAGERAHAVAQQQRRAPVDAQEHGRVAARAETRPGASDRRRASPSDQQRDARRRSAPRRRGCARTAIARATISAQRAELDRHVEPVEIACGAPIRACSTTCSRERGEEGGEGVPAGHHHLASADRRKSVGPIGPIASCPDGHRRADHRPGARARGRRGLLRAARRAQPRAVGGAARVVDPADRRPPRAGRRLRRRRLRARHRPARRRADHHRAGRGQHARRGRRGVGVALADPGHRHRHPVDAAPARASTAACCTRPTARRRCSRRS